MIETTQLKYLRIALVLIGIIFICIYPLMIVWPSGWKWHSGDSDYPLVLLTPRGSRAVEHAPA